MEKNEKSANEKSKIAKVKEKGAEDLVTAAHWGIAATTYYLLFSFNSFCLRGGPWTAPLLFMGHPKADASDMACSKRLGL